MGDLDLSMEAMGLIAEAEKRLRARIRDAVDEGDRIVFITEKGHLGQALGKEAKNLHMMRELLNKDVKFVEWDDDKQVFVRNLFKPFDLISVRLETLGVTPTNDDEEAPNTDDEVPELRIRAIVEVEPKDKGKAIGKNGRNISSIRHIAKRHHDLDEIQVI